MRKQASIAGSGLLAAAIAEDADSHPLALPAGFEIYARTPDFTHLTIPSELTVDHALAEGVWGVLRVLDGTLLYIMSGHSSPSMVGAGDAMIIEPQRLHRLQLSGPTRFFVEFHISRARIKARTPSGSC